MNKEQFTQLIQMGFSVSEALDLLKPAAAPEAKPEPTPEPKTEPEPKPIETPSPVTAKTEEEEYLSTKAFIASQKTLLDSIDKLTKAVQMNNIRTAGTDEDPTRNRADEFIAQMITGMKKED